jgi:plasmid stability protein
VPVSLSIKNVPDDLADRLRARATENHRSVQGELLAILENAVGEESGPLTVDEIYARIKARGFSTPDQATRWIREDRDAR